MKRSRGVNSYTRHLRKINKKTIVTDLISCYVIPLFKDSVPEHVCHFYSPRSLSFIDTD